VKRPPTIWLRVIGIMLLCIIVSLAVVTGCGSQLATQVKDYLEAIGEVITESADVAIQVSALYQNSAQMTPTEISEQSIAFANDYNDLLGKVVVLKAPEPCTQLKQYLIDSLTFAAKEITEYGAYHSTGDIEHLISSQTYYQDAQRAIALSATEWDNLNEMYK
jgi:hypothetical protein